jgi:hypothetical protein
MQILAPKFGHIDAFRDALHREVYNHLRAIENGTLSDWREEHFGKMHGRAPGVGNTSVNPYYGGVGNGYYPGVGQVNLQQYQGGLGAPVQQAAMPGAGVAPVTFSQPAFVAGGNSYLGLGLRLVPAATNTSTPQTLIDTRGTLQYNIKPIRPFNPIHLYFASTVIDLTVEQVKIQGIEVFSSEEPVFIEAFSEVSRVPAIQWLTIQESTGVTMIVGNPTAAVAMAKGTFHGTYVRQ